MRDVIIKEWITKNVSLYFDLDLPEIHVRHSISSQGSCSTRPWASRASSCARDFGHNSGFVQPSGNSSATRKQKPFHPRQRFGKKASSKQSILTFFRKLNVTVCWCQRLSDWFWKYILDDFALSQWEGFSMPVRAKTKRLQKFPPC